MTHRHAFLESEFTPVSDLGSGILPRPLCGHAAQTPRAVLPRSGAKDPSQGPWTLPRENREVRLGAWAGLARAFRSSAPGFPHCPAPTGRLGTGRP